MLYIFRHWVVVTLKILTGIFATAGFAGVIKFLATLAYTGDDIRYFAIQCVISIALMLCSFLAIETGILLANDSEKRRYINEQTEQ